MYLVTIENNGVETVINEVSTNTNNRVSGTIKQGINTINSFTFTIYPNNEGYNLINPLSTLVKVLNTKTNKYEFIGRVLSPTHSMSSNGLVSKSYICESELAYLLDTYQSYEEIHNATVKGYLERLIRVHNANTDSNKQFTVGNVNVIDNNDSLYRYVAYDTTKKNIDDDLIGKLGGELQIRYENDIRYLDYLQEIGKVCTTEIRLAKNLQDIEQNIDISGYCNRLVVLGSKLKTTDDEGNEVDTEERLTIESVNNGVRYIDDEESISKFGIIQGQVIYDDVTDAKNLFTKGQKYLLNQRILISNKVNALDLSLIGIDIDSFEVGNYYPLIHEILNINDTVRIVEKSISIDSPHTSTITLGDLEKDIKKYNIQAKNGYIEAKKIAEETKAKAIEVQKYTTDEIYRIDSNINTVVKDTSTSINDATGRIQTLENEVSLLRKDLNELLNNLNVKVNGVTLNTNRKELDVGQSFALLHTISPSNATNKNVFWHSNNETVATVNNGLVSAKASGNATITVTTEDGGYTSTCNVVVNDLSGGEETVPTNEYDTLKLMYPMPQPHGAIPNGAPSSWKYQSRWENQTKPDGWSAFCGWAQVYRVEGTPFSQNTGVELKDYQVYGWKNGQWHLVSKVPAPSGYFYAEDFQDDAHTTFVGKMLYYETSVAIRLTEDMTISTSTGTKNVCYHPFTTQLDYDVDFEYIFTCVSMRKIKWDENGVDDRDSARYCASCGGDWWREKGLTWAPDWSNNKGIAQPKIMEVTNDWNVFSMTTVPEGWEHGFPK